MDGVVNGAVGPSVGTAIVYAGREACDDRGRHGAAAPPLGTPCLGTALDEEDTEACNASNNVKRDAVIDIAPRREATLKRKVGAHLRDLGFHRSARGALEVDSNDKDVIRATHSSQRRDRLSANAAFLSQRVPALLKHFASGCEVDPEAIKPSLERVVASTWQADLFRIASLTWSIPVSNGFGRRLRYLVWDSHNEKLIGLIAIGDPVFNLAVRDKLIGWDADGRSARLVNMMDAYVLGALPPYNALLGGKMIACLVRSREVYDDFSRTYGGTKGIISGKKKRARLLAITTSSSMGRSSVYNRLKLDGDPYFKSIGYTHGWGHFHIPDSLFSELRAYLRSIGHDYADQYQYGQGPNWRLRTTRAALTALGFRNDLLRHGIQREVFFSSLANNAMKLLQTGKGRPDLSSLLSVKEVAELSMARWIVPRSVRCPEFRVWTRENLQSLLAFRPRADRSHRSLRSAS